MAIITTTNNAALSVPVLEDAIRGAVAGVKLLLGTGAWIFRPGLPSTVGGAPVRQGTQVTVPYFTHIGELDDIAEGNALAMHASAMAARPAVIYWQPTTLALLAEVRTLRDRGIGAWATMDAGPHVKVLTSIEHADAVAAALRPLAADVIISAPGGPTTVTA